MAQPLRNWSLSCQVFDEAFGSQESELPSHASTDDVKIRLLQVDTHCYKTKDPTRPDLLSSYVDICNHLDMHARIYRHLFV